jgi:hypothetical protein
MSRISRPLLYSYVQALFVFMHFRYNLRASEVQKKTLNQFARTSENTYLTVAEQDWYANENR